VLRLLLRHRRPWLAGGAALLCARKVFAADHRAAGSDDPVLLAFETYRQAFHYIRESRQPPEDVDKILGDNAQLLLGLEH
jgi:hypothetical protein